jgi:hypothetical protein
MLVGILVVSLDPRQLRCGISAYIIQRVELVRQSREVVCKLNIRVFL